MHGIRCNVAGGVVPRLAQLLERDGTGNGQIARNKQT
jgi:hypothetical protein